MALDKHIAKNFDPREREDAIYENWDKQGYFTPTIDPDKEPYTIVMPPPNITGQLHIGHALDNTLQDIFIRQKRMQGYATLWLPGTDHASIATEAKLVDQLAQEGLSKDDVGREGFLERAWAWRDKYGHTITKQLRKLGCSCDWTRERFTLDEGLSKAVEEVFINLYNRGLIYRGTRMIHWCPSCKTTISDIEVIHKDRPSHLWHLRYPLVEGKTKYGLDYLEVATTRPETMLGDTAVAVHPDDERYVDLVGKEVVLPLTGRTIPIVADSYVDPAFGTGVVKITPAHDPNDFQIGLRHNLETIEVIDSAGNMNENAGKFQGLSREECRKAIVPALDEAGALGEIEDYMHSVGTCQRCGTVIEPKASAQWFVKMKTLADKAIEAVRQGDIRFVPQYFEKTYFNWMENIEDWNISRQLWWGHRIPAWYCDNPECGHIYVGHEAPEACPECGGHSFHQDPDTLDTWFSSALWPFSTLGWPEETEDYKYFYPTQTLSTGSDIIFFWVARMIFQGLDQTGQAPFNTVFLHGIVLDDQGRKMSKSLGNGVDPLAVIDAYGTDALRYSLINNTAPGNNQRFKKEDIQAGRAFVNKIWNAYRFCMMNLEDDFKAMAKEDLYRVVAEADPSQVALEDLWIMSRLHSTIEEVSVNLDNYELGVALDSVHSFIWDSFCDWYIEMVKPRLYAKDDSTRVIAQNILVHVLDYAMRLLHPFMPFVTEEIYQTLPGAGESIMIQSWPETDHDFIDKAAEENMGVLIEAITNVRQVRNDRQVKPKVRLDAYLLTSDTTVAKHFDKARLYLERLAGIGNLHIADAKDQALSDDSKMVPIVFGRGTIFIPLSEMLDLEEERARLKEEEAKLLSDIAHSDKILGNQAFVAKAPEAVVNKEKAKRADLEEKLRQIRQLLD